MKKAVILLAIISIHTLLFAQNDSGARSPQLILYYSNDIFNVSTWDLDRSAMTTKIADYGFTTGINVRAYCTKRFSAYTGINFVYNNAPYRKVYAPPVTVDKETAYVKNIILNAVQIPIHLEYAFLNCGRWRGYIGAGLARNFKIEESLIIEGHSWKTKVGSHISSADSHTLFRDYEMHAKAGISCKLSSSFMINAEPIMRGGAGGYFNGTSWGVGMGLLYTR
jgi:hypothetical protein